MRNLLLLVLGPLALLALCLCTAPAAQAAADPYVIGAVFDITGPGAPLGTPERDTVVMLEKQLNDAGGINGHPVKVIVLDNASDEAKSVTAVKKLIDEYHVLAIIGPSQTGTTLAAADTVQAAKVPMISCAAGIKIVDPVKPWIFKTAQSDVHAVARVLAYCKAHNFTNIALLTVANAYGDSGKQQLKAQAPGAKIEIVAEESFGATDTDMTAQILRIRAKDAAGGDLLGHQSRPGHRGEEHEDPQVQCAVDHEPRRVQCEIHRAGGRGGGRRGLPHRQAAGRRDHQYQGQAEEAVDELRRDVPQNLRARRRPLRRPRV